MTKLRYKIILFFLISFICISVAASTQTISPKNSTSLSDGIKKSYTLSIDGELFSIDATGAAVGDILKGISKKTNIKISNSPILEKVTLSFKKLPLDDALKKLTHNRALIYEKYDNEERFNVSEAFFFKGSKRAVAESKACKFSNSTKPDVDLTFRTKNRTNTTSDDSINNNKNVIKKDCVKSEFVSSELVIRFKRLISKQIIDNLVASIGATEKEQIRQLNYYVLSLPPHLSVNEAMERFHQQGVMDKAEPNYIIPLKDIPDDSKFFKQWALNNTGQHNGTGDGDIDAPEAWDIEQGRRDVVIAVIDTGVDYTHEDLAANIWNNPGEIPDNGMDDDGNGYIDDHLGWDFVDSQGGVPDEDYKNPDNDPMDRHGHGTHIAGIAAAVSNNSLGIAGVARNCMIMPVRASYRTPSGDGALESVDAAHAIIYAAENGARVVNLSWGDYQESNLIEDAMAFAAEKGALICAAAGNDNTSDFLYPAASGISAVMAVGATDNRDKAASFSNYGDWVDISAPGVSILSTGLNNTYCNMSGTSMAVPHVAGVAALLFSHFPSIGPLEVKSRMLRSLDIIPELHGKSGSSGRINAYTGLTVNFDLPHIFSLSQVDAYGGQQITITGDCFGVNRGNCSVGFYPDRTADIISWSDSRIVCRVPEGARTGEVTIITDRGISNAVKINILHKSYNETLVDNEFQGEGQALVWKADDQSWLYSLPFSFPFFQDEYDTVHVCSNGFLDFTQGSASHSNSEANFKNRAMIAPLWEDLVTNGFSQQGEDIYISSPSSDSVCFRWGAERYETGEPVNVEAVLYEDGRIKFNYGSGNSNLSSTIGISRGDGSQYHFSGYDEAGQLTEVKSILFTPREQSFTFSLDLGWNLISFPVRLNNNQVNQVLGGLNQGIESVWSFESGTWHIYDPRNPGLGDLQELAPGRGYWIKTIQKGLHFKVQGQRPSSALNLEEGWNLVGGNSLQGMPLEEALPLIGGEVDSIWGYKGGNWYVYDPKNPGLSNLENMEPGRGYWLFFR